MDKNGKMTIIEEFKVLPEYLFGTINKLCLLDDDTKLVFIDPNDRRIIRCLDLIKKSVSIIYTNDGHLSLEDINTSKANFDENNKISKSWVE